jgi:hypothetical protein
MPNAIIPIFQGNDYQARYFWLQACRLFESHSKVERVGYELDDVKSFDDVAVFYSTPIPDERGEPIQADYYQIKYHVDQAGSFSWQALMDPSFIGATSVSFLQRLHTAQQASNAQGKASRFYIVAPWSVHPDDELAELVSNQGGELRLNILFDGTGPRSSMGKVRAAWCQHLGVNDDDDLEHILRPVRIHANSETLAVMRDHLNDKLLIAGMSPVEATNQSHPYDDLIRKVRATGQKEFTKEDIHALCVREGLWRGTIAPSESAFHVGLRSFMRWAEHMEDEAGRMLCFVRHFDNRHIRDQRLWNEAVFPELATFLSDAMREQREYHLYLDVHASIAFSAGYCLDPKSGVNVVPVQRSSKGRSVWQPPVQPVKENFPSWSYTEIEGNPAGNDVALCIGATHDIVNDVADYAKRCLPDVRRIMVCAVVPQPSPSAVLGGTHAWCLAQELAAILRQKRSSEERQGILHIFAAAPNALVFFIGQYGRGWGRVVLYEYDFESNLLGNYQPSMRLPLLAAVNVSA